MKIYTVIASLILISFSGWGQEASESGLVGYLQRAAENNPGLLEAYNRYLAALERIPQAGALPDPVLSAGVFIRPMPLVGGSRVADIRLMQMFPWFGLLKASKNEAEQAAVARYASYSAVKADLFYHVKVNWYEIIRNRQEKALVKENILLLETLEDLALVKYQSAPGQTGGRNGRQGTAADGQGMTMTPGMPGNPERLEDILRIRMEILEQGNELERLLDIGKTLEVSFNSLLDRDKDSPVFTPDSLMPVQLPGDLANIEDSIFSNNPVLLSMESEIRSSGFAIEKAKKMGLPGLGIGLDYMVNRERAGNQSAMNGKDMVMPMISLTIPLYRKKYRAMQKEATLSQESWSLRKAGHENSLSVEYRNFVQDLLDARRRISLYADQVELARKTSELLLEGYTARGTGMDEVLRMQYKVLEYGYKYLEAITDYNKSAALAEKLMNRNF